MGKNCPETPLGCDWWPGYLQLPLPGEQLLVSLLELILPLLGVQVLDQLGLRGHGRRTLARPPHQTARPLELQQEILLIITNIFVLNTNIFVLNENIFVFINYSKYFSTPVCGRPDC